MAGGRARHSQVVDSVVSVAVVGALRGGVGVGRGVATERVAPGRVVWAVSVTVRGRCRRPVEGLLGRVLVGGMRSCGGGERVDIVSIPECKWLCINIQLHIVFPVRNDISAITVGTRLYNRSPPFPDPEGQRNECSNGSTDLPRPVRTVLVIAANPHVHCRIVLLPYNECGWLVPTHTILPEHKNLTGPGGLEFAAASRWFRIQWRIEQMQWTLFATSSSSNAIIRYMALRHKKRRISSQ